MKIYNRKDLVTGQIVGMGSAFYKLLDLDTKGNFNCLVSTKFKSIHYSSGILFVGSGGSTDVYEPKLLDKIILKFYFERYEYESRR